ncbi:MAG: tetratricopeptide repeat protein [Thermoanaerobaculia bacterium]
MLRQLLLTALLALLPQIAGEPPYERMREAIRQGRLDDAVSFGELAIKREPARSEVHYWLGRAYAQKAQEASLLKKFSWAKKCRIAFEKAVQLDPSNSDAGIDLIQYYLLAPGFAGGGIEEARALAPHVGSTDSSRQLLAQALLLQGDGKAVEAEAAFRKALEKDPEDERNLTHFMTFLVAEKRFADGLELCRQHIKSHPDVKGTLYQLGKLASVRGQQLEEGLQSLDEFLKTPTKPIGPTWADARYRKGLILLKLGRRDEARAEFQIAVKLNPSHPGATKELKKF